MKCKMCGHEMMALWDRYKIQSSPCIPTMECPQCDHSFMVRNDRDLMIWVQAVTLGEGEVHHEV